VILESIVTTVDRHGNVNVAPMGPCLETGNSENPIFVLRPFDSSQTYTNLVDVPRAVVHVTDDVMLFARAAVSKLAPAGLVERLESTDWYPLMDCHRWFAVEVESVDGQGPRRNFRCRTIETRYVRPFFGFNRAKHAVIEAAILATRTEFLSATEIHSELVRLQPLVDKTAGPIEIEAFEFLRKAIDERLGRQ